MKDDWTWMTMAQALEGRDPEAVRDLLPIVAHYLTSRDRRGAGSFKLDLGWTESDNPGEHFVRFQRAAEDVVAEVLRAVWRGLKENEDPRIHVPPERHAEHFVYLNDLRRIRAGKPGRKSDPRKDADVAAYFALFLAQGYTKTSAIREVGRVLGMVDPKGSTVRSALKRHEQRRLERDREEDERVRRLAEHKRQLQERGKSAT